MDEGAWWAAVHGVAKSRTWLRDFTFTFHFPALEKEMATHSSVLAWRIPGAAGPGAPPSMGSHRVRHDWSDLAAVANEIFCLLELPPPFFLLLQCFWCDIASRSFLRKGTWEMISFEILHEQGLSLLYTYLTACFIISGWKFHQDFLKALI